MLRRRRWPTGIPLALSSTTSCACRACLQRLRPLQPDILQRRRPRERDDLRQRGLFDARSETGRPPIVVDRREPYAVAEHLLDIVQHRGALGRIGFAQLALIELVYIGKS